jgi:hypothetical protein
MPKGREIDAFGDSMLVGAKHAMEYYFPRVRMDAGSNRRWSEAPALIKARDDSLRRAVVLSFGTNAGTDVDAVEKVLDLVGPDRMVVLVTVHGPFARTESDNTALERLVDGRDNVTLAEWDQVLAGTSGMLQSDGVHPSIEGAHLYSATVRAALAELSEPLRIVVVLKDVYDWSHPEIAAHLDITVTAAKVRLHRGRKQLREILEHEVVDR